MGYRVRVALKAAVWIGSLWPLGVLLRSFLTAVYSESSAFGYQPERFATATEKADFEDDG